MRIIRYQPHVDGMRAAAVLLVILHHFGDWAGLRGGYVGVDVFFVISGFLITGIVKREVEAGEFTFGGFYKRRVLRLAPAYFTVLLASSAAALIWMLPAELVAYARSMVASSLFVANFHMWKEVGGYFGADADTAPLLHLWSLAVEEQFYLFWPIALLLGHRLFGPRLLPWLVLIVAIGGAVVSQWGVAHYPAAAYYLLPTRFFELAIGATLAFLPAPKLKKRDATIASVAGAGMIVYSALAYGKETQFPGYAALPPVLGTAMLLRWGQGTILGQLLSTSAATLVGRISYPAYLWHWPILVFLHINDIAITLPVGFTLLVVILVLSWLTFKYIELPARRFLSAPPKQVMSVGAGLPIAVSLAMAISLILLHGLPARFPESLNRKSEALLAFANKMRGRCNEGPPSSPLPPNDCVLGRREGKVNFLLVGDSHANHFTGFLDELGKAAGMRGYDMTRSNTPFLPGVDRWMIQDGEVVHHENFVPRNRSVSKLLESERFDVIVLAGNYTKFYDDEILRFRDFKGKLAFEHGMRAAIAEARQAAPRVIVITTVPFLSDGLYDCGMRVERFGKALTCTLPAPLYKANARGIRIFFDSLKKEFPGVVWIEPDKLTCDQTDCATEMDGIPLYKDRGHLNDVGSRLLARKWLAQFGNPLVRSSEGSAASH